MEKRLSALVDNFSADRYLEKAQKVPADNEAYGYRCYLNCRLCPYPGAKCMLGGDRKNELDFEHMPKDNFVSLRKAE